MSGADIVGRERELEAAAAFFDVDFTGARAIVIAGPPGIGKTTVWHGALSLAEVRGCRVLVSQLTESEARLSYTVLGDLFGSVLDGIHDALPPPQRRALEVALLRAEGGDAGADRRAVSLAVLGLMRELAAERPMTIAIDDVQWIDGPSASALSFALRRMTAGAQVCRLHHHAP